MKMFLSTQAGWKNRLINPMIGIVAVLALLFLSPVTLAAETWPLLAGQSTEVGKVVVDHDIDAGQVSVTYTLTDPNATFGTLHLWVGDQTSFDNLNKSNRPPPGKYPYRYNATGLTTYTFTIELTAIFGNEDPCGRNVYVIPHAEVVYRDKSEKETAYGFEFDGKEQFNTRNKKGNILGAWWYYGIYNIDCTVPDQPACFEYQDETAWSAGNRYNPRICTTNPKNGKETCTGGGNWATYTKYEYAAKTVDLIAGQNQKAGTVTFSDVNDGKVTITIDIASGWRFKPVAENVKIQGYTTAPSGNPVPGRFTTHKGQASGTQYRVEVGAFNYYGVHVDVQKVTEVPCPSN